MKLSDEFYELSIDDLSAANTLFNQNKYHLAIYHLQQSVEKLVKAYSLEVNIIPFDKFKDKVGHAPQKVFKKQAEKHRVIVNTSAKYKKIAPEFFDLGRFGDMDYAEYKKETNKSVNKIQHLTPYDFQGIDDTELDEIITHAYTLLDEIEIDGDISENDFEHFMKNNFGKYLDGIAKYNPEEVGKIKKVFLSKEGIIFFRKLTLYQIELIPKTYFLNYSLLILSFLTALHGAKSRYPCSCGFSPKKFYQKGFILVDKFNDLSVLQKKSIGVFQEIFHTENKELMALGANLPFD